MDKGDTSTQLITLHLDVLLNEANSFFNFLYENKQELRTTKTVCLQYDEFEKHSYFSQSLSRQQYEQYEDRVYTSITIVNVDKKCSIWNLMTWLHTKLKIWIILLNTEYHNLPI